MFFKIPLYRVFPDVSIFQISAICQYREIPDIGYFPLSYDIRELDIGPEITVLNNNTTTQ
jgi:hypothetical protein